MSLSGRADWRYRVFADDRVGLDCRNERYQLLARTSSSSGQVSGWSAHNLHMHERRPWTKGADGWAADELDTMPGHSVDIR